MNDPGRLTPKGERTREHIVETALDLFINKGYHVTTMRDIAAAAGCSIGLTYRYVARKEDIVLALYYQLAQELESQVQTFPAATLAERFLWVMQARLTQLQPYRELFRSILGAALSPNNDFAILGTHTSEARAIEHRAFDLLVSDATNAPKTQQAHELATVLHAAHMCLLLFWFYDRSPQYRATEEMIDLAHDVVKQVRRMLRITPVARLLTRFARAIEPVFGSQDDG